MINFKGRNIRVFLKEGIIFSGKVTDQDEYSVTLVDDRKGCTRYVNLQAVSNIEVVE